MSDRDRYLAGPEGCTLHRAQDEEGGEVLCGVEIPLGLMVFIGRDWDNWKHCTACDRITEIRDKVEKIKAEVGLARQDDCISPGFYGQLIERLDGLL